MSKYFEFIRLKDVGIAVHDCEHKTPLNAGEGYPYIAIPNLVDGRLDLTKVRRITEEDLATWTRRTNPQAGDVIITRRGRVGDSAIVPPNLACAIGQNLVILRSDGRYVDQAYLRWATRGLLWQEEVNRLINVGAVFESLNVRDISQIRIPVPPLSVQRGISQILGALDDKIAVNDRITSTSQELTLANLEEMIIDDPDMSNILLGEVASVNKYKVKPRPGGFLRYIDISSVSVDRFEWPERTSWEDAPGRARRGVTPGDTIWSTVRPGRRSRALVFDDDPEIVVSTGFAVLTPREVGPAFLYEVTRREEFVQYLESVAEGSAYPAVRAERFEKAPIPLLSPDYLQRFESRAIELQRRIHAARKESRTLSELRDTLLPKLMSGEIRVRDAEQLVEDAA